MKNKILSITLTLALLLGSISAGAYTYEAPYDDVTIDQNLLRSIPQIYSLDTIPKRLVASADFESSIASETLTSSISSANHDSELGALVVSRTAAASKATSLALKYGPGGVVFEEGDMYAFVCRVKETGATKNGGKINVYVDGLNSNGKTIYEYNQPKKSSVDENGWYTATISFEVKKNTSYLTLHAYVGKEVTGTVYFDDFTLYKLGSDPLETVLVSPSYKGLIYGNRDKDINLDVLVFDRGGFFDLSEMEIQVTLESTSGETVYTSGSDNVTEKMNFVFPTDTLSEGDYFLRATLYDKETGEEISHKEDTIRKRSEDYRPDVYVDENGHIITNGEKTFFTSIYNSRVNVGNTSYTNYDKSYEFAKETGISSVANYGMGWWNAGQSASTFKAMREDGIKSHIALNAYIFSLRSNNGNEAKTVLDEKQENMPKFFKALTDGYKDDPILSGYYIFDEADPYILGEEIRWNNEILAACDIDHPTFGAADKEYSKYGIYTRMADILQFDPYPVTGKTDETGKSTDDIAKIGRSMRLLKENFPNRPVQLVQQGFKYASSGDAVRPPSYDELRNMAWQAICEGAEGIAWYSYHEMFADKDKPLSQWTEEVKALTDEIKLYQNAILSDEPVPNVTVRCGNWLNYAVRRYNGKTYLFAVNNTFDKQTGNIRIQGIKNNRLVFKPLEVKILSFDQEDVLSSADGLLSLGFSKGDKVLPMTEGENEKIIYVPNGCNIINYSADISSNAKLLIGSVEVPESGRITVKNTDTFKVHVVSQDGKHATTHKYRVVRVNE